MEEFRLKFALFECVMAVVMEGFWGKGRCVEDVKREFSFRIQLWFAKDLEEQK